MATTTLTRNEIRSRARAFASRWKGVSDERAEKDTFWNEFFQIFGVERRQVATFERNARRISTGRIGRIDVFWPGNLIAEHKSLGKDLAAAIEKQALDYLGEIPAKQFPRLVVASDFARLRVLDLDQETRERRTEVEFALEDLPHELDRFMFLAGYEQRTFRAQDAVNVEAAELLGRVYERLEDAGYPAHDLQVLIVRLLFVLFADDTGLWPRGQFERYLKDRTVEDGHDLGLHLARLFDVLNTKESVRTKTLDEELAAFPYVNGGLFKERIETPDCTPEMRTALLDASAFDWSGISPAIFGSMFQSVMNPKERHSLGAHYTTEQNIRKVIEPLFLDDLKKDLEECGVSKQKLRALHERLSRLTFFDPAMGCGNFLVIAYRELRRLETELLRRLYPKNVQLTTDLDTWRKIKLNQFFGIEMEEFPARIAETAMYLVDHLENESLGKLFGVNVVDLPLRESAQVLIGNALTTDWEKVLPASACTYVLGNPPFLGQKMRSPRQTEELRAVWGAEYARWLDYVTGWYKKASDYIQRSPQGRVAFVSTNSITQGEQAGRVWRPLLQAGMEIDFAHRTFKWSSEARGTAHVHVVIVGFSPGGRAAKKTLFDYETVDGEAVARAVTEINPYLVAAPTVLVHARGKPLSMALSSVEYGNKPADGGFLVVEDGDEPTDDPIAMKYLRTYVGAKELMHSEKRSCLWLVDAQPSEIASSRFLKDRVASVRKYRQASSAPDTRKYADYPARFFRIPQPTQSYIAIPRHGSDARHWFTVARFPPSVIASDALFTAMDPDGFLFGVLSSKMFLAWMKTVGGMIKSDPRFSASVVYNPFPLPVPTKEARARIIQAGKEVAKARSEFAGTCLADLYEPSATPAKLVQAHAHLDREIDRLFRPRGFFTSNSERLEALFERYADLTRGEAPTIDLALEAEADADFDEGE